MTEKINLGIGITGVVLAGFTLWIAYLAYEKFAYQQIQGKQIEAVTELVEYIHKSTINLSVQNKGSGMIKNMTLFELSENESIPNSLEIYFTEGHEYPIVFEPYIINPLIPKEIADVLINFHSYPISIGNDSIMKEKGYIRLTSLDFINKQAMERDILFEKNKANPLFQNNRDTLFNFQLVKAPAYRNYGTLVKYSELLKSKIRSWYNKQGIGVDDINLRDKDLLHAFY